MLPRNLIAFLCILACLAAALNIAVPAASAQQGILAFPTAAAITSADTAFVAMAKDYFARFYGLHPLEATYVGVHEFDDRLDDTSPDAFKQEKEMTAEFLEGLSELDPAELSRVHRHDYLMLKENLSEILFELTELRRWETSPLFYTNLTGGSIRALLSRDFAPWDVRLRNAISRLNQFPRLLEQAKVNIKSSPRVATETAIGQNAGCISYIEEDLRKTAAFAPEMEESLRIASEIATAALRSFGEYLESDLLPRSNADWRLGKELYARKLRYSLGTDTTPEELVAQARKSYEATRKEAIELSRRLHGEIFKNHAHGEGVSADEEIAREVYAEIAKDHVKADGLLAQCQEYVYELENFVREKDLLTFPAEEKLDVVWTPEFERGVADGGLESPGALEKNLKAFFYVGPVHDDWSNDEKESYLREYNDYLQQIFSIHEAIPGHYVQGWYANQFPSLVRALLGSGPFVEGWAVYSEIMMLNAGYGDYNPRLKLSHLKWMLRVIINAIIDPGLHCGTMTEQEALDLMTHGGFQEEREARGKIVRASLTSTQLPTYYVGVEKILEIEKLYKQKMGDRFSQKAFNEKLLSFGAPPLGLLEELMLEDEVE